VGGPDWQNRQFREREISAIGFFDEHKKRIAATAAPRKRRKQNVSIIAVTKMLDASAGFTNRTEPQPLRQRQ
jgi:hypothetical protein